MDVLKISALLLIIGLAESATPKQWVLLVAGSNTWWNYRHQADICHAYHIAKRSVPEENIITMMYDDIANASENPNKGKVINKPGGEDVYAGVKIDYKGIDVNPTNFLNILQGNKTAMTGIGTGRVIESGPDDIVFVNFADHGGVGLLCFPNEYLYSNDFEAALDSMVKANKFNKMLMYIEACESGSMFDHLIGESNKIFVSTAAAADESSYAWYCDGPLDTCLGDLYSITWMEHMDEIQKNGLEGQETLFHQYNIIRTAVNESHVQLYGDFSLGFDTIKSFLGSSAHIRNSLAPLPKEIRVEGKGVSSRDVPLYVTKKKIERTESQAEKSRLEAELEQLKHKRDFIDITISQILSHVTENDREFIEEIENKKLRLNKNMHNCYKNLINSFNKFCFNTYQNTYAVGHFYKFVNLCSVPWTKEDIVIDAMSEVCSEKHKNTFGAI